MGIKIDCAVKRKTRDLFHIYTGCTVRVAERDGDEAPACCKCGLLRLIPVATCAITTIKPRERGFIVSKSVIDQVTTVRKRSLSFWS